MKPWHTNISLLLLGTGMLLLCHQLVTQHNHVAVNFSDISSLSLLVYALAVWTVFKQPVDRFTFPIVLAIAVACPFAVLFHRPYLSTDVYRYAWDGVVQHAHISPYRYVPGDPALAFLRAPNQNLFDNINRRDYAHTIYPPGAQFLFYLITCISPGVTFMKLAMVLFECLTMYSLLELLHELRFPREQMLLFAWCPLLFWEVGSGGHLDAAAMAFITLALLARYRRQPVATGIYIGLAILIKLYPLVLLPALFRRGEYKMLATVCALVTFGYACYSSVGMRVFGFLGYYAKEEGMESGARYFLLELAHASPGLHTLPTSIFLAFAALVFMALTVWCWNTCCNPRHFTSLNAQSHMFQLPMEGGFLVQAFVIAFALMILFSPHYPWYGMWLVPFLALIPNFFLFTYICGFYYLCTTKLAISANPSQPTLNRILYGSVLLAFLIEVILHRFFHRRIFTTSLEEANETSTLKSQKHV